MRTLLALIASVGLVGCVGDVSEPIIDDGSGTPETDNPSGNDLAPAKKLFDDNVFPIFQMKCTGGTCHSEAGAGGSITKFVASTAAEGWKVATNYTALVGGYTNAAPALTKIEPGNHYNVTYAAPDKEKIVAWLAKELELRQNAPPTTPGAESLSAAADRVMSQFAGCMTLTNFQQANMANAWGNLQSNEGACQQCHQNAGFGFIANNNANIMFPVVSTKKMYFLQYFTVNLQGGAAAAKVEPNRVSFAGVCNNQAPHIAHPRFNCNNNNGFTALTNFYNLTVQEIAKGTCQPKPLEN
jgi:hypothetical protein